MGAPPTAKATFPARATRTSTGTWPRRPGKRGRHPLPDRDALAGRFAAWGIRHGDQLVAYDDAGGQFACRFWWLARWLGVESCAVLDGGLAAYLEAGGELTRDKPVIEPSAFRPRAIADPSD